MEDMMFPGDGSVPPKSVQIRGPHMFEEVTDEYTEFIQDVWEFAEDRDELEVGIQEKHPGGVPADAFLVIAAKSAAGTVGVIAVQELYEYIKSRLQDEDSSQIQIKIDEVHINLSEENKRPSECGDVYNSVKNRNLSNFEDGEG